MLPVSPAMAGVMVLVLGAGCQERRFDAGLTIVDAPVQEVTGVDRPPIDRSVRDIVPHEGLAGDAGECRINNGGVEICNNIDDDCNGITDDVALSLLQNDIAHCGACMHLCVLPSAESVCQAGKCVVTTCAQGYIDTNKQASDGCECKVTNSGVELCDGLDNDCNGQTDEGFALDTVNNCGTCGHVCQFPFAAASCTNGACVMGACQANFYDRDGQSSNGCESMCVKTNGGKEICDGVDNDCDGTIDNGVVPTRTCKTAGVCSGTVPVCSGDLGWTCAYTHPEYQSAEDASKGCDGLDNDCDDQTDEALGLGKDCSAGKGDCLVTGQIVCDPVTKQPKCNAVAKAPAQEICNGKDDDCNGLVDEITSATSSGDMFVYLPAATGGTGGSGGSGGSGGAGGFAMPNCAGVIGGASGTVTMFAYEASRYDSTATGAGFDTTLRPCSLPSRLPWTNITQSEAAAACARIVGADGKPMGWRLCTESEWERACNGNQALGTATYPYGTAYNPTACNGDDYNAGQPIGTGTAVNGTGQPSCVSSISSGSGGGGGSIGIGKSFDMSGNVKEWVSHPATASAPTCYALRGGAYNTLSFPTGSGGSTTAITAPGMLCNASTPAPSQIMGSGGTNRVATDVAVRLPSVGFRCCYPGKLPN